MNIRDRLGLLWNLGRKCSKIAVLTALLFAGRAYATGFSLDIITTLSYVQNLLAHLGPMLSAVLFIVAGMFYAIGQLLPATKRAAFHTTTVDILMGAIIVAVLSVASNGFALASTQLLTNVTVNSVV
jgi:hypothetical protein